MLRPDGHFLYTDVRNSPDVAAWEAALAEAPLRMMSMRIINTEVARGWRRRGNTTGGRWLIAARRHSSPPRSHCRRRAVLEQRPQASRGKMSYRIYCFAKT